VEAFEAADAVIVPHLDHIGGDVELGIPKLRRPAWSGRSR